VRLQAGLAHGVLHRGGQRRAGEARQAAVIDQRVGRLELRGEIRKFRQEADPGLGGPVGGGMAEDPDLAGVGEQQAGDQLHDRRLARAVKAQQAGDLAGRELERDVRQRGMVPRAQQAGALVGLAHASE